MVDEEVLGAAASLIREGKLVAFPTETVYGLGANALDPEAVARIFEVKGRPFTSPIIVHVQSVDMARNLVERWPDSAERLAKKFWPGPLTLVLRKHAKLPDVVTGGLDTVGLRVPAHPVALELLRISGVPIAAPSANRFSELSPTTAEHVRQALGNSIEMIVDGGPSTVGIESTVLSLCDDTPVLLRPGMISQPDIEAVIGPIEAMLGIVTSGAHPSPGLHPRHYSPRTPLLLVVQGRVPKRGNGMYIGFEARSKAARTMILPLEPTAYAAELYQILHEADNGKWDWIAVECPPDTPEWAGILDRLNRAAQK